MAPFELPTASSAALIGAGSVSFPVVLALAALTGAGMLAGVWIIRSFEGWAVHHTTELIAFAAGVLVAGALLHLLPSATRLAGSGTAVAWTLGGFLVFYLIEAHFVPHVHPRGDSPIDDHHHGQRPEKMGMMVLLGLGIHSLVDGVSVGAGLSAGALLGGVTALLVIVHKMPVGIAAMSALYHSGVPGRRAGWITTGLAMVTPVAVLGSYLVIRGVPDRVLGILVALAGGSFLYIGAADLLPEGQGRGRPLTTAMFLAGAAVMVAVKVGFE